MSESYDGSGSTLIYESEKNFQTYKIIVRKHGKIIFYFISKLLGRIFGPYYIYTITVLEFLNALY